MHYDITVYVNTTELSAVRKHLREHWHYKTYAGVGRRVPGRIMFVLHWYPRHCYLLCKINRTNLFNFQQLGCINKHWKILVCWGHEIAQVPCRQIDKSYHHYADNYTNENVSQCPISTIRLNSTLCQINWYGVIGIIMWNVTKLNECFIDTEFEICPTRKSQGYMHGIWRYRVIWLWHWLGTHHDWPSKNARKFVDQQSQNTSDSE